MIRRYFYPEAQRGRQPNSYPDDMSVWNMRSKRRHVLVSASQMPKPTKQSFFTITMYVGIYLRIRRKKDIV